MGDGTVLIVEEKLIAGFLSELAMKPLLDNDSAFLEVKFYETLSSLGNDYYDTIAFKQESIFQVQNCMYFKVRGPTGKVHVIVALPVKESFAKAKAILMIDIIVIQDDYYNLMKDNWNNHKSDIDFAFDQDIEFV